MKLTIGAVRALSADGLFKMAALEFALPSTKTCNTKSNRKGSFKTQSFSKRDVMPTTLHTNTHTHTKFLKFSLHENTASLSGISTGLLPKSKTVCKYQTLEISGNYEHITSLEIEIEKLASSCWR